MLHEITPNNTDNIANVMVIPLLTDFTRGFIITYVKASCSVRILRNSLSRMTRSFGKGISFRTSKCLSSETINAAFVAMAQSTNLLSSISLVINSKWYRGSTNSTKPLSTIALIMFSATIELAFFEMISLYSSRISFETQRTNFPCWNPVQTWKFSLLEEILASRQLVSRTILFLFIVIWCTQMFLQNCLVLLFAPSPFVPKSVHFLCCFLGIII